MTSLISENINQILERIKVAALKSQRDPAEITLVAVSKKKSVKLISEAIAAGQLVFGENYVQEAAEKISEINLGYKDVKFHFIGHLQSNKIPLIAGKISCLQSLDSLKLARKLNDYYLKNSYSPLDVMLQINISQETQKAGIDKNEVENFFNDARDLPYLNFIGLMAIGSFTEDTNLKIREFEELRQLKFELEEKGIVLKHLSMGMTDDYELAIHHGATIVRVGTGIFGERGST